MKTLKTSRKFWGGPISVGALCGLEDRSLPVNMMDIVSTTDVRHYSGKISTGDVDCSWVLTARQNGFWSVNADFRDNSIIAGDFFFVEFVFRGEQGIKGIKLEGSILSVVESRHLSLSSEGSDQFIRENWQIFEASGPTVRLHAAPAIGSLIGSSFVILGAVAVFVYGGGDKVVASMFGSGECDPHGRDTCVHMRVGGPSDHAGEGIMPDQ